MSAKLFTHNLEVVFCLLWHLLYLFCILDKFFVWLTCYNMCCRLYVIIMSCTSFRVNLHSIVCLNVKELLARSIRLIWSLSERNGIRTQNHLNEHSTIEPNWPGKWLSVRLRTKWLWLRIPLICCRFIYCCVIWPELNKVRIKQINR